MKVRASRFARMGVQRGLERPERLPVAGFQRKAGRQAPDPSGPFGAGLGRVGPTFSSLRKMSVCM